jgi:hypothetical protein
MLRGAVDARLVLLLGCESRCVPSSVCFVFFPKAVLLPLPLQVGCSDQPSLRFVLQGEGGEEGWHRHVKPRTTRKPAHQHFLVAHRNSKGCSPSAEMLYVFNTIFILL